MVVSQFSSHPFLSNHAPAIISFLDRVISKSPVNTVASRAYTAANHSQPFYAFTRPVALIPPQPIQTVNISTPSVPSTAPIINIVTGNNTGSSPTKGKEELDAEKKQAEEEKKKAEDKTTFVMGTVVSLVSTLAMGYLWGNYKKAKENYTQSSYLSNRAHTELNTDNEAQDRFMQLFRELSASQRKIDASIYHRNTTLLGSAMSTLTGGTLTVVSSFISSSNLLKTSAKIAGYVFILAGAGTGLFTLGLWLSSHTDKTKLAQMAEAALEIKGHIQTSAAYYIPNASDQGVTEQSPPPYTA